MLSLDNLSPLRAMSSLNGDKIPTENDETFSDYGRKDIYGKQSVNVFEGT